MTMPDQPQPTELQMQQFYLKNSQLMAHDPDETPAGQQVGRDRAVAAHTAIQKLRGGS